MIVPVRCEGGSIKEWGLIELQGSIQLQREWDFSQGLPVGTIQSSPTDPDHVQLQIGYHLLEGKRLPLKKPVAILAKQQQQPGQQGHSSQPLTPQPLGLEIGSDQLLGSLTPVPPSPQPAAASSCDGGGRGTSYKVVGVLRHKYLFKTRAKALISKPQR